LPRCSRRPRPNSWPASAPPHGSGAAPGISSGWEKAAFAGVAITMFTHRAQLHDVPMVALIGPALVVPLLVAIMVGAVAFGRTISRGEPQFLVDFLKRTLEAK
jgi:hypothetical protein